MESGHRLFWGDFGPFMMRPIDSSTYNVHLATARALVRRGVVVRRDPLELVLAKP